MIVEHHNKFEEPVREEASRVVIYDDNGTPVAFAIQLKPGHIRFCSISDSDFNEQLSMHGLAQTGLLSRADIKRIKL